LPFNIQKVTFRDLNLNTPLLNALDDLQISVPTPIQANTFPVVMSGKDVVGIAQTGTGKTFAYLLPILRQLNFSKQTEPRVIILVPTRELVEQVVGEAEKLSAYINVRILGVYGGVNLKTHAAAVMEGCDIVVATPGRLLDLALNRTLKLKSVKKLVIDEVDEMMNLGFRPQLTSILDLMPEKRQNILFSATLIEEVEKIIDIFFNNPERVQVAPSGTPLEKIEQLAYSVPNFYTKINLLTKLLKEDTTIKKGLIFIATKKQADLVHEMLEENLNEAIGIIHSNKSQNYRLRSVSDFETGATRLLIATDIIARGIDISDVSHVFNFDMPEEPENYIHRIGRTGRAEAKGIAISFVTEQEELNRLIIEEMMNKTIGSLTMPDDVEISEILLEEEKPAAKWDKQIGKAPKTKQSSGAFHEKKAKNMKKNLGGPSRRRALGIPYKGKKKK
jgi:ATP-dependent RNA helicase RhlE